MTNTSTRHIVLIDDDSDDFNVLSFILEDIKANVRVTSVTETEDLIDTLKMDMPDLILLDLAIPKKCGIECLQEVRTDLELRHVPVVVYTDSRNTQEIDRVYDLGASMYVQKPSTYREFVDTMEKILSIDLKVPQYGSGQPNVRSQTSAPAV
jgi:CheY-like chemotaxis protein